jgi:type I restriction enzyme M protein
LRWIASTEKDAATVTVEKRLGDTAEQFRANSSLGAQEYSGPALSLILLRFGDRLRRRRRPHGYELCSECVCP